MKTLFYCFVFILWVSFLISMYIVTLWYFNNVIGLFNHFFRTTYNYGHFYFIFEFQHSIRYIFESWRESILRERKSSLWESKTNALRSPQFFFLLQITQICFINLLTLAKKYTMKSLPIAWSIRYNDNSGLAYDIQYAILFNTKML